MNTCHVWPENDSVGLSIVPTDSPHSNVVFSMTPGSPPLTIHDTEYVEFGSTNSGVSVMETLGPETSSTASNAFTMPHPVVGS